MILSMTGFGSGAAEGQGLQVRVAIRSVNSRFCEIQVRCPSRLQVFENPIRERLTSRIGRGKITASVEWDATGEEALPGLDETVARHYLKELERLRALGGLAGQVDLALVAALPGVFRTAGADTSLFRDTSLNREEPPAGIEALVLGAVDQAIEEFEQMLRAEGRALEADLRARVGLIEERLERIAAQAGAARQRLQTQLREKVEALLRPGELAEERLALEVVLLAERSDIAEELVRFHSHNAQFAAALDKGGEVGRRFNFLLQEMNREANTISSKANDAGIIHLAVEIKEEVERLREQVQNLA